VAERIAALSEDASLAPETAGQASQNQKEAVNHLTKPLS
jgi:hypothetical protein